MNDETATACIWLSIDVNGLNHVDDVLKLHTDTAGFLRDADSLQRAGWIIYSPEHNDGFVDFKAVKETTEANAIAERDAYAPGRTLDYEEEYGL